MTKQEFSREKGKKDMISTSRTQHRSPAGRSPRRTTSPYSRNDTATSTFKRQNSATASASPFRDIFQRSHTATELEGKLSGLLRDYNACVVSTLNPRVEAIFRSYMKTQFLSPNDINLLENVLNRNRAFMKNVETTLAETVKRGGAIEVSVMQRCETQWRSCHISTNSIYEFLDAAGVKTGSISDSFQTTGTKASRNTTTRHGASTIPTVTTHTGHNGGGGRHVPASVHELFSAVSTTSVGPTLGSVSESRGKGGTPRASSAPRVSRGSSRVFTPTPAPTSIQQIELVPNTKRCVGAGRNSYAAAIGPHASATDEARLHAIKQHSTKHTLSPNDLKVAFSIFHRSFGAKHGAAKFVSWMAEMDSIALESVLPLI